MGLAIVAFGSLASTLTGGALVTVLFVLVGGAPWLCGMSLESLGSFSFSAGVSFSVAAVRERVES